MTEPLDRAQRIADLKAARAAIDRELALLVGGPPALAAAIEAEWVTLKDAARHCRVHPDTMVTWARVHGLGRRIGRTWRIDMARVRAHQEGRSFVPLPADSAKTGLIPDEEDPVAAAS